MRFGSSGGVERVNAQGIDIAWRILTLRQQTHCVKVGYFDGGEQALRDTCLQRVLSDFVTVGVKL